MDGYDHGQQLRPPVAITTTRSCSNGLPVDVWVNLAAAYPLPRSAKPVIPQGIDLTDTVAARLHLWAVTTTGHWVGWVTYEDRRMKGVTAWVVAAALEQRFDQPARRDQYER